MVVRLVDIVPERLSDFNLQRVRAPEAALKLHARSLVVRLADIVCERLPDIFLRVCVEPGAVLLILKPFTYLGGGLSLWGHRSQDRVSAPIALKM